MAKKTSFIDKALLDPNQYPFIVPQVAVTSRSFLTDSQHVQAFVPELSSSLLHERDDDGAEVVGVVV